MDRVIAIGDIHGCADALHGLVEVIKPTSSDTLVILGDYIDRGSNTKGVIDQLLDLDKRCDLIPILGNHEEMLLSVLDGRAPKEWWLQHGGRETLESYDYQDDLSCLPESHLLFCRDSLQFYETDSHLFLHANYVADEPMSRQPVEALRWQSLDEYFPKCHSSGKTAIVGHTCQRSGEILDVGYLKCLDTGCFKGGWLTAMDVTTGTTWQVDAKGEVRG